MVIIDLEYKINKNERLKRSLILKELAFQVQVGGGVGGGNNNFDFVAAISVDLPFSRPLPQYVIKLSIHSGIHYRIIINLKKEENSDKNKNHEFLLGQSFWSPIHDVKDFGDVKLKRGIEREMWVWYPSTPTPTRKANVGDACV